MSKYVFDTGMTIEEAARRAEKWWSEFRGVIPRAFDEDRTVETRPGSSEAPMLRSIRSEVVTGSNVLAGAAWEDLTDNEREKVTVLWHHFHVRQPLIAELTPETKTAINIGQAGNA